MRSEPVLLQAVTCKEFYGWESLWKLYICEITWGTSRFEVCVDKVIRHNATKKQQLPERGAGVCMCPGIRLHAKTAAGLGVKLGGREVVVQAGELSSRNVPLHTKTLGWGEENPFSAPLGKLQVMICLPRSVLAFFIACLLLGRGRVYQVQVEDIKQIYPCYF